MKKCPFCAEQIQEGAIKCKYCKSMLPRDDTTSKQEKQVPKIQESSIPSEARPKKFSFSRRQKQMVVIAVAIIIGVVIIAYYANNQLSSSESNEVYSEEDSAIEVEMAYWDGVVVVETEVIDALVSLEEVMGKYSTWTAGDREDFITQTEIIEEGYTKTLNLTPTAELSEVHKMMIDGYKNYSDAMQLLRAGVDNNDPDLIREHFEKLEEGHEARKRAVDLAEQINPIE